MDRIADARNLIWAEALATVAHAAVSPFLFLHTKNVKRAFQRPCRDEWICFAGSRHSVSG